MWGAFNRLMVIRCAGGGLGKYALNFKHALFFITNVRKHFALEPALPHRSELSHGFRVSVQTRRYADINYQLRRPDVLANKAVEVSDGMSLE